MNTTIEDGFMTKFSKEFTIAFRDCDGNGRLRIHALVDFMQDIARQAATELGVNFETPEVKYYWIIIRSKIHMIRTPKIDETISIETFYSGADKLYAVREFHIYDQNQVEIGTITGYYLLMEHGKARPVKIRANPNFPLFDCGYTGAKVEKLTPSHQGLVRSAQRCVYSGDIDGNGHMNNAHYVRWCTDMFSTEELQGRGVTSFQIQYVKELLEGAEVSIHRYEDGYIVGQDESTVYFIGKIVF